jgi:tRNA pseudouridine38-40 synthase
MLEPAEEAAGMDGLEDGGESAQNWKLTLAYDGTDFHGWQLQPEKATVQGELAAAIERVTGERVLPQGSGRTDAGVHALGQVASFAMHAPIPPANLARALNRTLPAAIRILQAEHAPAEFHARHSAVAKTYTYRLFRRDVCPPFLARYVCAVHGALDVDAMRSAAAAVLGEHDFSSFAATDPDRAQRIAQQEANNVRCITRSEWDEPESGLLVYTVSGSGFLHHMVRNLVGTFLEVGRGQRSPQGTAELLRIRNRSAAGATAPARGLFLHSVTYLE